jgi:hypothetical protein
VRTSRGLLRRLREGVRESGGVYAPARPLTSPDLQTENPKNRKKFFFEKKNQKTF